MYYAYQYNFLLSINCYLSKCITYQNRLINGVSLVNFDININIREILVNLNSNYPNLIILSFLQYYLLTNKEEYSQNKLKHRIIIMREYTNNRKQINLFIVKIKVSYKCEHDIIFELELEKNNL